MTLYSDLGVPDDATKDDIRSAYRHKAGRLHPDKPDGDEEEFKKVQHAYMILSDHQKRETYDKDGTEANHPPTLKDQAIDLITGLYVSTAESMDFARKDYFPPVREALREAKVKNAVQLIKLKGRHDSLEYLISHIKCDDRMLDRLRGKLDTIAAGRDSCEEYIKVLSLALEAMDDYTYFGYEPHTTPKITPHGAFGGVLYSGA